MKAKAAFLSRFFVPEAERKAHIHHHHQPDDLWRRVEVAEWTGGLAGAWHVTCLPAPLNDRCIWSDGTVRGRAGRSPRSCLKRRAGGLPSFRGAPPKPGPRHRAGLFLRPAGSVRYARFIRIRSVIAGSQEVRQFLRYLDVKRLSASDIHHCPDRRLAKDRQLSSEHFGSGFFMLRRLHVSYVRVETFVASGFDDMRSRPLVQHDRRILNGEAILKRLRSPR